MTLISKMEGADLSRGDILNLLVRLAFATAASYITVRVIVSAIDPTSTQKKDAKKKAQELMKRLGIMDKLSLTEHEFMIASQLVEPSQLNTSWNDVAGLSTVIRDLRETLILPIQQRTHLSKSKLIQPPKGILLHGPPGCGKTLLARAVAREAGARFINLDVASLTDKWYGESQKLSSAVFSLATKIQPCIIFIDEIDSFLRVRATGDHEATAMMKAQFLQQWDGLATDSQRCVVVMGATNRPQDVDRAILRRMPTTFHIPLPSQEQRKEVLDLILRDESVASNLDTVSLAQKTKGFSGSDLRELCRTAAVYGLHFLLDQPGEALNPLSKDQGKIPTSACSSGACNTETYLREINNEDFLRALNKMQSSSVHNHLSDGNHKIDLTLD